jgi:class 3 adenylate cyclase
MAYVAAMSSEGRTARESRTALRRLQHEMRTPLGQIIGYSEMLLEEARGDHQDLVSDLEKIHRAAEELLGVVDQTLKIDAGPVVPADSGKDATSGEADVASAPGRILVVDDEPNNRDMLSRRLMGRGYSVDQAEDGVTALRMIEAERFDVVLLDVMMPGMSGLEVLDALRRDRSPTELPVILATALTDRKDVVEGLGRGANDYVTKPIDFPIVLARVETQLAAVHAARELTSLTQEVELRGSFIRRMFGRYVSDDIADAVMQQAESLELGGEKRRVSILMSDLVSFTPLTESLEAGQVVAILNNHLSAMTDVIQAYGGTIDEFIGDAILAFFGAPIAREDDSARAVACALAMQDAMSAVNDRNRNQGLPDIAMRIAIATGDVVVGNIGSERRSKYAAVGSAINLAARIEAKAHANEVMISDATQHSVSDVAHVAEVREIVAKGFDGPVRIHRVTAIDGSYDA